MINIYMCTAVYKIMKYCNIWIYDNYFMKISKNKDIDVAFTENI